MAEYVFECTVKSLIAEVNSYSVKFNGDTIVRKNNTNYIVAYEKSGQGDFLQAILLSEESCFSCGNDCVANLIVSNTDGRFKVTVVKEQETDKYPLKIIKAELIYG